MLPVSVFFSAIQLLDTNRILFAAMQTLSLIHVFKTKITCDMCSIFFWTSMYGDCEFWQEGSFHVGRTVFEVEPSPTANRDRSRSMLHERRAHLMKPVSRTSRLSGQDYIKRRENGRQMFETHKIQSYTMLLNKT